MTDQRQKAGEKSLVVQSGGDTHINLGVTAEDMRQILGALGATQIEAATAAAREEVRIRIDEIGRRIVEIFSQGGRGNPAAFNDPDFQYLLTRAQHAFARSGDDRVADTIIDVIAERSKLTKRDRLMMTLNDAVETAATLTRAEFAVLSLVFLLKRTINTAIGDKYSFIEFFHEQISPLLSDIDASDSCFQYLESQRCANIQLTTAKLQSILHNLYGGIFSKGFTDEELMRHLPEGKKEILGAAKRTDGQTLLVECLNDPSRIQFRAQNHTAAIKELDAFDLNDNERKNLGAMYQNTFMPLNEIQELVNDEIPDFHMLVDIWDHSSINRLQLTSLGTAIGHSNLRRLTGFSTDLSIWIN